MGTTHVLNDERPVQLDALWARWSPGRGQGERGRWGNGWIIALHGSACCLIPWCGSAKRRRWQPLTAPLCLDLDLCKRPSGRSAKASLCVPHGQWVPHTSGLQVALPPGALVGPWGQWVPCCVTPVHQPAHTPARLPTGRIPQQPGRIPDRMPCCSFFPLCRSAAARPLRGILPLGPHRPRTQ
jgi:hypothetical protein